MPDKAERISIRLKALLALGLLLWASDFIFDHYESATVYKACAPKGVTSVDTSGFWTITIECDQQIPAPQ